jgi:16S rRNA (adenine1518-N6/adenine1519-N6)-dimethyltransferase
MKNYFFLRKSLSVSNKNFIYKDFLKWNPEEIKLQNFALIGNFPCSISSNNINTPASASAQHKVY